MKLLMFFVCLLSASQLLADRGEQKQVFGKYEVHYIALNSSFLTPEVAKAYDIPRSRKLAFFNISVLKKEPGAQLPVPVRAKLVGTAKNLIGQSMALEFNEVRETNAIYYIAPFRFDEEETYRIKLDVTPEGSNRTLNVKFSQRLYEE